jgi:alpha-beta hydrolase superfamily lysophospholipase
MFLSTESNIDAINEAIPLLKVNDSSSLANNIAVLREYFQFYGFNKIDCPPETAHYAGVFESAGVRMFANTWELSNAEHSVLIVHGLFDHTGLYLHLVQAYLNEGFNVMAFDLPGHGLSEGERASIDNFHQYGLAVKDFLDMLPENFTRSISMTGQSTGCSAIMSYLQQGGVSPKSMVYLAPLVRPCHWQKIILAYSICKYCTRRISRRFAQSSHNPEFTKFLEHMDGLQHPYVELKWIAALRKWLAEFSELPNCDVPTLVVQGTGDSTVDWNYNIPQIKNKYSQLDVKYLESAKHHLANESEQFRGEMLNMCTGFVRSRL